MNKRIVFVGTLSIDSTLLAMLPTWDIFLVYSIDRCKASVANVYPSLLVIDPFDMDNERLRALLPDFRKKGIRIIMYTTPQGEHDLSTYDEEDYDLFISMDTLDKELNELLEQEVNKSVTTKTSL